MSKKIDYIDYVLASFLCLVALALGYAILHAATTPTIGTSDSYAVLASTFSDTSSATTITGDIGFTTPPATAPLGTHINYGSGAPYSTAGIDQGAVLSQLNSQSCDFTFGSAQDLSLLSQPLTPGVYCVTGAQSIGTGGITLTSGTYIFRSTGALNTTANSIVSGGNSCNIFWTPLGATTLGANSTFLGTDIDDAGITVGSHTTWSGRALAFGGTVTTDSDTITVPTCSGSNTPPPVSTTTPPTATTTPPTPVPPPAPVVPPVTSNGGNGQIACSSPSAPCFPHPTPTPIQATTTLSSCVPIANFQVDSGVIGDGKVMLSWGGGGTSVTILYGLTVPMDKFIIVPNDLSYEVTGLQTGHWNFQLVSDCSVSNVIDPEP